MMVTYLNIQFYRSSSICGLLNSPTQNPSHEKKKVSNTRKKKQSTQNVSYSWLLQLNLPHQ